MNIPILTVRDENGNIIEIPAIKGDSYVLTEADKQEIAEIVFSMLQSGDEVSY
jgi:DNA-binding NarL/FixJ family response regulator